MIGRDRDLSEIVALCRADARSIVTVTGPGGVGKTELALMAARRLVGDFPDGVFVVELEGVPEASAVVPAIVRTLELADVPDVAPLRRLADHLRDRRMLLVLDNFEHVLDAAVDLIELITAAAAARLLVTSQAPLRVAAEHVFALRPLALPDGTEPDLAALAEVPSVALLLQHAQSLDRDIAITHENAEAVAELCKQLDGLPLGLELAASRLALLSPAQLLGRLGHGLDALGRGRRDLPPRQSGLRATLDWTTRQLSPGQADLLTRLAVFVGGFSLALAEAVGDGDVIDDLGVLRDLSLIRRDPVDRLSMPPPVRTFALELPGDPEMVRSARARHAGAVLQLFTTTSRLWVTDFVGAMRLVTDEAENLREALRWTRNADPDRHAELAGAAAWWFRFSGNLAEGVPELDAALATTKDPALRVRLLMWRDYWGGGTLTLEEATSDRATSRASVEACRQLGDARDLIVALFGLSNAHGLRGEGELALAAAREAQIVARGLSDEPYADLADLALGPALEITGDPEGALDVLRPLVARARPRSWAAVAGLSYLADAALAAGDARSALAGYCRWLRDLHELGSAPNDAFQLDGAAMALAALGRHEEAVVAAELSDRIRREHAFAVAADFKKTRDAALAGAREALGEAVCHRCQAWVAASDVDAGIASIAALA
jgi:predicted ATPase